MISGPRSGSGAWRPSPLDSKAARTPGSAASALRLELTSGGLAGMEALQIDQRLVEPARQQAPAHRRQRLVDDREQRELQAAAGTGHQFEVAPGLRIEGHVRLGAVA